PCALRPLAPGAGRPQQDLGFGSVVSDATRRRFLNRDGTFNVKRTGLSFAESRSLYRYLSTSRGRGSYRTWCTGISPPTRSLRSPIWRAVRRPWTAPRRPRALG